MGADRLRRSTAQEGRGWRGQRDSEDTDDADETTTAGAAPSLDYHYALRRPATEWLCLSGSAAGTGRLSSSITGQMDRAAKASSFMPAIGQPTPSPRDAEGCAGQAKQEAESQWTTRVSKDEGRAAIMGRRSGGASQGAVRCAHAHGRQFQFRSARSMDRY